MKLFVSGISYRTAPVELREQLAVSPANLGRTARELQDTAGLLEVVLLATCNRVEIYGVTPGAVTGDDLLQLLCPGLNDLNPSVYHYAGAAAIRHLFRVAAGLESMVLGETEITSQVKHACETARSQRLTAGVLNRVFQTALQTAKKVRSQTDIGRGATSAGSVAVELAQQVLKGSLASKTA